MYWKHLGEVHQSNQILPICNSFIQSWATSSSLVQRWAISGVSNSFQFWGHFKHI